MGCGMWDVTQNCPVLPPKLSRCEKLLLSLFTSPSAFISFGEACDDVMMSSVEQEQAEEVCCFRLYCADKINRSRSGRWSRRSIDK